MHDTEEAAELARMPHPRVSVGVRTPEAACMIQRRLLSWRACRITGWVL